MKTKEQRSSRLAYANMCKLKVLTLAVYNIVPTTTVNIYFFNYSLE